MNEDSPTNTNSGCSHHASRRVVSPNLRWVKGHTACAIERASRVQAEFGFQNHTDESNRLQVDGNIRCNVWRGGRLMAEEREHAATEELTSEQKRENVIRLAF